MQIKPEIIPTKVYNSAIDFVNNNRDAEPTEMVKRFQEIFSLRVYQEMEFFIPAYHNLLIQYEQKTSNLESKHPRPDHHIGEVGLRHLILNFFIPFAGLATGYARLKQMKTSDEIDYQKAKGHIDQWFDKRLEELIQ